MATVYWPADLFPAAVDYGIEYDVQVTVRRSGAVHTYGLPGARWVASLAFGNDTEGDNRPRTEALVASLRGGARRISMPHLGRPVPNGDLRGTPVLGSAAAPGHNAIEIAQATGGVRKGDILGVAGQLLMMEQDAAPTAGRMWVAVSPAVRISAPAGQPVVWNRPEALWIPRNSTAGPFPFAPGGIRPGFSLELVEVP